MYKIITNQELLTLSNDLLLDRIKDKCVTLNMHDGTMKQVRIKGLIGTDVMKAYLVTYTEIRVFRSTISTIEIMDESDFPIITI